MMCVNDRGGVRVGVTIFGSIGSRASRCLWVVEELGIDYAWKSISTLDGSNRAPEYRAIIPSGKIPAMTDGADVMMTESMAINQYLAEEYGRGTLWPAARAQRATVLQWTFWSATEVEPFITDLFPQLVLKAPADRDMALVERLLPALVKKLAELEAALAVGDRDYLLGADFTLADVSLAVQTFTFVDRFKLDLTTLPRVRDWTERCRARPARQRVEAMVVAGAKAAAAAAAAATAGVRPG
jgi:glutathione S-transferase